MTAMIPLSHFAQSWAEDDGFGVGGK